MGVRGQGWVGQEPERGGCRGRQGSGADFHSTLCDLPCPIEGGEIQTASTEAEAQGQMETPGASRCQGSCIPTTVPGAWLCAPCTARLQVLLR